MTKPLLALARTDIVLYLSDRRALLITLAAPILIAAFFGFVLGGPPKKPARVPVALVDLDQSMVSRQIAAAIKRDSAFAIEELSASLALTRVRAGQVRAAVVVPAGFGAAATRALFRADTAKPEIAVHFDPSQTMAFALVKGLLTQHVIEVVSATAFGPETGVKVIADSRAEVAASAALEAGERSDLLALFDSLLRLQTREPAPGAGEKSSAMRGLSIPFTTKEMAVTSGVDRKYNGFAHSFAGMGVQFILFMGIELGMAVLLMRRQGLWKRLRAAPLSRGLLLGSRIVSGTVIATLLLAGIYAAAIAFFGVRIEGSLLGFVGVGLAFALLTATFGLLIAALGRTPEATRGIAIVATLLLVMLGGAWVPTFVFPAWLQQATLIVPTRWAIDGLEAMTWRGLGLSAALAPIGVLLGFSALFALCAVARFDWEE